MVGSWSEMNQGSRAGKERRSWLHVEPEEPRPEGDRASVVAKGGSAGVDHQSASQIEAHKEQTIAKLEQELRTSHYQPQAVKRVWIPKAGSKEKRPLGCGLRRELSRTLRCVTINAGPG